MEVNGVDSGRARGGERARGERGRLLVEIVVAAGIGAVALLGLAAVLPLALRVHAVSKERGAARRAADQRLVEIVSMDEPTFRRALAAGPTAPVLTFTVDGLAAPAGLRSVGTVAVTPAPGTAEFDAASLFQVRVDCRWAGANGAAEVHLQTLFHPPPASGGAP